MRHVILVFALLFSTVSVAQGSYISRLWNTKKYSEIITYTDKADRISAMDNLTVGQAFMKLDPPNPAKALYHYDVAIGKKLQSEDLYFQRSKANYALGKLDEAMGDLEVCLTLRPNYQKYMLSKGAIAYEMGDLELAYNTYYDISELYDKQLPFYMLAVISLDREQHKKAQDWVDKNMLRFEQGKEFWTFTAEQQVRLEWRIFGDHSKALKAQNDLLKFHPNNAQYLLDRLALLRITSQDSLAQLAENDFVERYNMNALPSEFYKKGNFKVAEYTRPNGVIEDYRYFRPGLYENTKYVRFYLSEGGQVLDKHWAGLVQNEQDTTLKDWDFHRMGQFLVTASDTNYAGFQALFDLPEEALVPSDTVEIDGLDAPEQLDRQTPIEIKTIEFQQATGAAGTEVDAELAPGDAMEPEATSTEEGGK